MAKKVLIIGATSAIAQATALLFAARGDELFLIARHERHLQDVVNDLNSRFNKNFHTAAADLNILEHHPALIQQAIEQLGGLDSVLIAHGTLSNQDQCQHSAEETLKELTTNCLSVISLLIPIANYFEQQGHGSIAVIGSVAGDRGRQSNYTYGTAKAAMDCYLQGLRNRLAKKNIQVLTIKPGLIDTPMTKAFKKNMLWAQPEQVAKDIVAAIDKKKDVVYTPFFWRYIMLMIRFIPERFFKRLKL